jgi:hypothetical protein
VNVSIYNTTGQKIDTLIDTAQTAGKHEVIWDASRFAAGVYFYKIQATGYAAIKKCVLVK